MLISISINNASFPVVTEVRNFYEVFPMIPNHFISISIYNSVRAIFVIQICTKIIISQNIDVDYHINNPYFIPLTISAIYIHIYTTHLLLYSILEYFTYIISCWYYSYFSYLSRCKVTNPSPLHTSTIYHHVFTDPGFRQMPVLHLLSFHRVDPLTYPP